MLSRKPVRLVRRLLWLVIIRTVLRRLCNLVHVRVLLYVGLLIDFHFQREDFEEYVDMAYHLKSEDECEQAENSDERFG